MRSRSYLFLLAVIALGAISGILYTKRDYNYGLDVRGGVRLTYAIDQSKVTPDMRTRMGEVQQNLRRILEARSQSALGVVEGTVQVKGDDQFVIELPGFTDVDEAIKTLGTSASIKFYWAKTVATDKHSERPYGIGDQDKDKDNPAVTFYRKADNKEIKPGDPEYLAMIQSWGDPILQGDDLKSARPEQTGIGGSTRPLMEFTGSGSNKIEDWSRKVQNQGENLAAVLDNRVLSIAPLKDNTILRDNAVIDGQFDPHYVKSLTDLLNSGALPVDLTLASTQQVDPTIGQSALNQMVAAGLIAFGIICLFLLVYYVFPGLVAVIALMLYVLFTLTVLKWIGATFSLASIAGFILSVGMAVDANILVFERFKEEMRSGKPLTRALELGFNRALPAIIDSNACTILTSLVLINLGTGPVKGFATTLMIGVIISLFTAVSVTRSLLMFLVGSGIGDNPKWYAVNREWFGKKAGEEGEREPYRIVENSKKWFGISLATIIPGLIFIAIGGLKPNVEFRGGYEATYDLAGANVTADQMQKGLDAAGLRGGRVQISTENNTRLAIVSVPELPELKGDKSSVIQKISAATSVPAENNRGFTQIGPVIQRETLQNAILGVLLSAALIVVYLAFRFGIAFGGFVLGLRFGLSAIGALLHDILVVIGVAAILGYILNWEISALFITAMLTMIGFSVHDTIVIFDRIRENLRRPQPNEDFGHLVDRSITQSFSRSINTSMTVIVTLAILVFFGTATIELKSFCVAMLVGIASGTYSSIYNASPILYLWDRAIGKKRGDAATLMGSSKRELAAARVLNPGISAASTPAATGQAQPTQQGGRSYGQVRRRASASEKGHVQIEDDV